MNPLHALGQPFQVELYNPNPTASKTKEGPIYRLSFEVKRELWDAFMGAETKGMLIEGALVVTATNGETKRADAEPREPKATSRREVGLAEALHVKGYFRAPALWLAMHDAEIYTAQQHKAWLETQKCSSDLPRSSSPCQGDVIVHHCNAANTIDGGKRQPEAPQKPLHFYGLPICHAHHTHVHGNSISREDKQTLLAAAVDITAKRIKAAIKSALGLEHLSDLTEPGLLEFEDLLGVTIWPKMRLTPG